MEESHKSSRDLTFDIARALCMLWIIGVWHIFVYIGHTEILNADIEVVTKSVLACFTFISGYFLGKKCTPPLTFYYIRFKRFYVLFVVACLLMLGKKQLFLTVTGLCNFILPQPLTLWYMAMLLLFYMFTPYIIRGRGSWQQWLLLRGLTIWALLRVFMHYNMMDPRVPYYFLFYNLGLITTNAVYEKAVDCKFLLCGFSLIMTIICMRYSPLQCLAPFFGMIIIIAVSSMLKDMKLLNFNMVMAFVSYSSLCAYLYHRPIYRIFWSHLANESGVISLYYVPLMVLTVIVVSWAVQSVYDKYIMRVFDKIKM